MLMNLLFTRFLFVENEQPAAEQAIRIEKDISLWGGFEWTAGMLDSSSTDYTTTHQLFVDFFNNIFDGIKTKYGLVVSIILFKNLATIALFNQRV